MLSFLKSKRRKELERKEIELAILKNRISELDVWCGYEFPQVGFAMRNLVNRKTPQPTYAFRDFLRSGKCTSEEYVAASIYCE